MVSFILLFFHHEKDPMIEPKKPLVMNPDFRKVRQVYEEVEENKVFTNYEDFIKYVDADVTEEDFQNHHYLLISISYDPCVDHNITPTDYIVAGNNYTIRIEYDASCGVCPKDKKYFLLEVDSRITNAYVTINYIQNSKEHCDPNVSYKPMIYLYPEEEMEVEVVLGHPEYLTTTYPKYHHSWKVTASPNGTLTDGNRSYYGLYWEGIHHQAEVKEDGFVVKREDLVPFLEEKLHLLGLTDKEANEMIVYWLPKLEENKWNYIRFETIEEMNRYMPLDIIPKPDTLIRIMMDMKPLEKPISVQEQKLTPITRKGFTVVEWGGSILTK